MCSEVDVDDVDVEIVDVNEGEVLLIFVLGNEVLNVNVDGEEIEVVDVEVLRLVGVLPVVVLRLGFRLVPSFL